MKDYKEAITGILNDAKDNILSCAENAYQQGVEDGSKSVENWNEYERRLKIDEAYQRGLSEAWECVNKILNLCRGKLCEVFPESNYDDNDIGWITDYSASEAIEKIKEYEEKQKSDMETIKV